MSGNIYLFQQTRRVLCYRNRKLPTLVIRDNVVLNIYFLVMEDVSCNILLVYHSHNAVL